MKNLSVLVLLLLLFNSCKKEKVISTDLIRSLKVSATEVPADGSSTLYVTAEINEDSDPDRRIVVFTSNNGSFGEKGDSTISQKAIFEGEKLISRVQFKAPISTGTITIKARVDLSNEKRDFTKMVSVQALSSIPDKLTLTASSFSVMVKYGNEISIIGQLVNNSNKFVSKGNKVIFSDSYEDGTPVNGFYRQLQLSSNASSNVSATYTPGEIGVGKRIWLKCHLLDENGRNTTIKDSILIHTISNN
ncbi:hypothetical protein OQX61_08985 [Pedobacter sp. PLR]|uniref:hypothetical protein n=1 Tax=Pedobacter sp. PLR TaxID=2994465 RepID=UPI002245CB5B|nr:hypothetical protein [Pedobacter sp. PLR]MCX2451404.1 hypothetical protein [Pedobacter sp. PLR]